MADKLGSGEHVLSAFSPLTSLLSEKADACAASVQLRLESVDALQGTTLTGPFPLWSAEGKNSRLTQTQSLQMLKLWAYISTPSSMRHQEKAGEIFFQESHRQSCGLVMYSSVLDRLVLRSKATFSKELYVVGRVRRTVIHHGCQVSNVYSKGIAYPVMFFYSPIQFIYNLAK